MGFFKKLEGLRVLALVDEGDITLDAHVGGAGGFTRGGSQFVNDKGDGYCLGKGSIGCLSVGETFIPFTWSLYRANKCALAAPGTDSPPLRSEVYDGLSPYSCQCSRKPRPPRYMSKLLC